MPDVNDAREDKSDEDELVDKELPFDKSILFWDIKEWKKVLTLGSLTYVYLMEMLSAVDLNFVIDPDDRTGLKQLIEERLRNGQFVDTEG